MILPIYCVNLCFSLRRQSVSDLASILWHTPKTIDIILNVIVSAPVNPPTSMHTRLSHALSLMQSVAKHPSTQSHFLQSQFLKYILSFLENLPINSNFELLRCESLDVIVALDQVIASTFIIGILFLQILQ